MKKLFKGILYVFLGLIAFVFLYFGTHTLLSRIPAHRTLKESTDPQSYDVYILSNGVHTDLVFPTTSALIDWRDIFSPQNNLIPDSTLKFIAIGWGDKGFYLNTPEWKDLSLKTALVAGLGIGETALHVTYYRHMYINDSSYKSTIDAVTYQKLIDYVKENIDGNEIRPILIETSAQYSKDDAFYEAKGSYNLFFSCNTWTNRALKRANMPSAVWTVFDKGILRHYQ